LMFLATGWEGHSDVFILVESMSNKNHFLYLWIYANHSLWRCYSPGWTPCMTRIIFDFSTGHQEACIISLFRIWGSSNRTWFEKFENKYDIHPDRVAERYCLQDAAYTSQDFWRGNP
jgi:hypothetical protein